MTSKIRVLNVEEHFKNPSSDPVYKIPTNVRVDLPNENIKMDFAIIKKGKIFKKTVRLKIFDDKFFVISFDAKQELTKYVVYYKDDLRADWVLKSNIMTGVKFLNKQYKQRLSFVTNEERLLKDFYQFLQRKIFFVNFYRHFTIGSLLGTGNFSKVFEGKNNLNGEEFAIKLFNEDKLQRQTENERRKSSDGPPPKKKNNVLTIKNEANLLWIASGSRNVLQLYEVYDLQSTFCLVLEKVQGVNLKSLINSKHLFKQEEVKSILRGILKGVGHLHERTIMHRDLKLDNIMIRDNQIKEENICIIDFGLSSLVNEKEYLFARCGSPGYVAPEILEIVDQKNAHYEAYCDVFSIGAIFHYLLLYRPLFIARDQRELVKLNKACQINYHEEIYKNIDQLALDLMKRMLEKNPLHRITCEEALKHPYLDSSSSGFYEDTSEGRGNLVQLSYFQEKNEIFNISHLKKTFDPVFEGN